MFEFKGPSNSLSRIVLTRFRSRFSSDLIVTIVVAVALFAYMRLVVDYALQFPQYDDFPNLVSWAVSFSQANSLSDCVSLFARAQWGHEQLFIKVFLAPLLAMRGKLLSLSALIIAGNLIWCIGVFFLMAIGYRISSFSERGDGVSKTYWLLLPVALVCLSPLTYDSISFAAGSNNFAYLAFALAAIYFVKIRRSWALILSIVLAGFSALSSVPGFIVFLSLMLVLVLQKRWRPFATVGAVLIVLAVLNTFVGAKNPPVGAILQQGTLHLFKYFLLFLGGMVGNMWLMGGYFLGGLLLLFWIVALIWTGVFSSSGARINPTVIGLAAFCILVAPGAVLGRSRLGLAQAVSSRYALISAILFFATYYAVIQLFPRLWRYIIPAMIVVSAAFNILCYWLYIPGMESQWNMTIWDARRYFYESDITAPPVTTLDHAFKKGIMDRAQIEASIDNAKPILQPPVRNMIDWKSNDTMVGSLESVGEAPELIEFVGWAGIEGMDLLQAKRWLVLDNDQDRFIVPATPMFRVLPGTSSRLAWSGFAAFVDPDLLPPGGYRSGLHLRLGSRTGTIMFPGKYLLAGRAFELLGLWKTPYGNVSLEIDDDSRFVVHEGNNKLTLMLAPTSITIPSLNKEGRVSPDRIRIEWSDGSVWTRIHAFDRKPSTSAARFLGQWYYLGKACSIEFSRPAYETRVTPRRLIFSNDGTFWIDEGLTLINDGGARAQGAIQGRMIDAEVWKTKGELSSDGHTLKWSNGTVWYR